MRRLFLAAVLVLAAAAVLATPVAAQGTGGFQFGLKGGLSLPNGTAKDAFDDGYHGGLILSYELPALPLGLRVDGDYHRFDAKEFGGVSGRAEIFDGNANLVLGFKIIAVKPYVLAGYGIYDLKITAEAGGISNSTSETKGGWNAGAGVALTFGKVSVFVEGRYHEISLDGGTFKFIPVSVGILF